MKQVTPFLWFDSQAEEAAAFYASLFPDSGVSTVLRYDEASAAASGRPVGSVLTVAFRLAGQDFVALNGGPVFSFTPATSLFVSCATAERATELWEALRPGGSVMMPFDRYPFSERYGWLADRYGLSWQIGVFKRPWTIAPALMFVGEQAGKAEEAMRFYTSLFPDAGIDDVHRYTADDPDTEGTVKHAVFRLLGHPFIAMDSGFPHAFTFTPALSFEVGCATQAEVDRLWEALSADPSAEQCGWLRDRFGVSWQIVPTVLMRLLGDPDPARASRVMRALLGMKKLDMAELQRAHGGG